MLNWEPVDRILWMVVLCLVTWCTHHVTRHIGFETPCIYIMKVCDRGISNINSKFHIIYILITVDIIVTKTSPHLTILHNTCRPFTSSSLNFTQLYFNLASPHLNFLPLNFTSHHYTSPHFTSLYFTALLDYFRHSSVRFISPRL
jgi:hypothetical protein